MKKFLLVPALAFACAATVVAADSQRQPLSDGWLLQSSVLVPEDGARVSTTDYKPQRWWKTRVPSTVLSALTRNGVYPDFRIGLNSFRIPDASDEFNRTNDLAKFSHLPDKRNPWKDPYWYRTEFSLPKDVAGRRVWLNFNGLNYRADIWLNGKQIADAQQAVGAFSRYRFDVTEHARAGRRNCLAVKMHPVDHVGVPETQLEPCGKDRKYRKEIMKDVTLPMISIGYDCAPTVPDRQTGLWQDVYLEFTGPVAIRDPFVVTRLPLPDTSRATLEVSAELANAMASPVRGVLRGRVEGTEVSFEQPVELAPNETKLVRVDPKPVMERPRLWWPKNYGEQHLYEFKLEFEIAARDSVAGNPSRSGGQQISDAKAVTFGVRQVTRELHKLDGAHGLRVLINGQKIFCRGGYIQPEVMFEWDAKRIEAEIRYLTEANINLIYFEDIPNPPDVFLDLCDRYGLMFGNCFYGCYWMQPGSGFPTDLDLLARGTVDIIKRYRNHPSLVLYMAMNEGETREDVYLRWRKEIIERDGTRLFIPSGSFPDYRTNVPAWIKADLPTGANDYNPKSYSWVEPAQFFRWIRDSRNWMFILESGAPSVPPMDSLSKFIPDLDSAPADSDRFPLTAAWAHHDACHYFKPFDDAVRRIFGRPKSIVDYVRRAAVLSADQHRAMYEAANHRMWDISSGVSEWKLTACWPSVEWQIYDWYLKPMPSFYFIRKACEPLHVQMTPFDSMVSVINHRLEVQQGLEVAAQLYDVTSKLCWEKRITTDVPANSYKEVFDVPPIVQSGMRPAVHFVRLQLKDRRGAVVSNNFYWLPSRYNITQLPRQEDLIALEELPPVTVRASMTTRAEGAETVARVKLENPGKQLAFFVHAAITRASDGEEIVPVLWSDNYISLAPGEVRELTARFATADAGRGQPALEIGGWNVESPFKCAKLQPSKSCVKSGETFTVTTAITDTFLDGSRVPLLVDGQPADAQWTWARGAKCAELIFKLTLREPGAHRLAVANRTVEVMVEK
ncbi:MAG: beta galactosidase jelly roll domain-containing protein [Verrucomicrobia bacterium]|nr:beta galactosidase jelly roll domain-containing protein [Verrucomicrobiota bacterium]